LHEISIRTGAIIARERINGRKSATWTDSKDGATAVKVGAARACGAIKAAVSPFDQTATERTNSIVPANDARVVNPPAGVMRKTVPEELHPA